MLNLGLEAPSVHSSENITRFPYLSLAIILSVLVHIGLLVYFQFFYVFKHINISENKVNKNLPIQVSIFHINHNKLVIKSANTVDMANYYMSKGVSELVSDASSELLGVVNVDKKVVDLEKYKVAQVDLVVNVDKAENSTIIDSTVISPVIDSGPNNIGSPVGSSGLNISATGIIMGDIAVSPTPQPEKIKTYYASRPTNDYVVDMYIMAWQTKIEQIGRLLYPSNFEGVLRVATVIKSNGEVESVEMMVSSNKSGLDEATKTIIMTGSPYSVFPESMKSMKKIRIVRKFVFLEN